MPRTVDSVRQVSLGGVETDLSPEPESDRIELGSLNEYRKEPIVDNYPFDEVLILEGSFEYRYGRIGTDTAEGLYQIRPNSGLLVVRKERGNANLGDVVDAVSESIENGITVHERFLSGIEFFWNLIGSADEGMSEDIEVRTPVGKVKSLRELKEEEGLTREDIKYDYPVESARLFFTPPHQDISVELTYANDTISISATDDKEYEYVLQIFERDVLEEG